ncbi:MAG: nucleotide sugar dehydrogenase [Vallitalea sp.]|jgi:UDP-N-acetyl-D-galactosamine dehydrogenase|nr:nucleotide sugar dehydrogenase [Vallitalea sp.]
MDLYNKIIKGEEKIAVIGLGYVGVPLAISFAKKVNVIGFDINKEKVEKYKQGIDPTNELNKGDLDSTSIFFTSHEKELRKAKFHIIAVPTPINDDKTPNLSHLKSACKIVGRNLSNNSIVVFESTVFPGVTEEICMPILEKESGLVCGKDFKIGYSPERINPGDKVHTLEKITKIVSGMDDDALENIAKIYEIIIKAGIYKSKSIKVAESAKVIENAQRDINIAFMNELSIIFNNMNINTKEVLEAADTKWNFLSFSPGLVGGHCIGVDPYYFTYKAEQLGYHSQIILAGRRINDNMSKYVAENIVKMLISADKKIKDAKVAILGITFKENCPDIRNTKVIDIINKLLEYGIKVIVSDPVANKDEVMKEYNIELVDTDAINDIDAIVFAVSHNEFNIIDLDKIKEMHNNQKPILIDVKGIFNKQDIKEIEGLYWSL